MSLLIIGLSIVASLVFFRFVFLKLLNYYFEFRKSKKYLQNETSFLKGEVKSIIQTHNRFDVSTFAEVKHNWINKNHISNSLNPIFTITQSGIWIRIIFHCLIPFEKVEKISKLDHHRLWLEIKNHRQYYIVRFHSEDALLQTINYLKRYISNYQDYTGKKDQLSQMYKDAFKPNWYGFVSLSMGNIGIYIAWYFFCKFYYLPFYPGMKLAPTLDYGLLAAMMFFLPVIVIGSQFIATILFFATKHLFRTLFFISYGNAIMAAVLASSLFIKSTTISEIANWGTKDIRELDKEIEITDGSKQVYDKKYVSSLSLDHVKTLDKSSLPTFDTESTIEIEVEKLAAWYKAEVNRIMSSEDIELEKKNQLFQELVSVYEAKVNEVSDFFIQKQQNTQRRTAKERMEQIRAENKLKEEQTAKTEQELEDLSRWYELEFNKIEGTEISEEAKAKKRLELQKTHQEKIQALLNNE